MPTKIYFKGGANVQVKGDSMETAVLTKTFSRWAGGIAMNGHELRFRKSDVLCYEYQPEAEHQAEIDKARKAQEEQTNAIACKRCGTKSPQAYNHCPKCGAQLVKKDGPKPVIPS